MRKERLLGKAPLRIVLNETGCVQSLYITPAESEMIELFVACFRFNISINNIISVEPMNLKIFSRMLHLIEGFDNFLEFFYFIHSFERKDGFMILLQSL